VDVVESNSGTSNDTELRRGTQRLRIDLCRAANDHRIGVGESGQQRRAVRTVDLSHLDVVAERGNPGRRQFFSNENDRLAHRQSLATVRRYRDPSLAPPKAATMCDE